MHFPTIPANAVCSHAVHRGAWTRCAAQRVERHGDVNKMTAAAAMSISDITYTAHCK